jgi:hypothetical protein
MPWSFGGVFGYGFDGRIRDCRGRVGFWVQKYQVLLGKKCPIQPFPIKQFGAQPNRWNYSIYIYLFVFFLLNWLCLKNIKTENQHEKLKLLMVKARGRLWAPYGEESKCIRLEFSRERRWHCSSHPYRQSWAQRRKSKKKTWLSASTHQLIPWFLFSLIPNKLQCPHSGPTIRKFPCDERDQPIPVCYHFNTLTEQKSGVPGFCVFLGNHGKAATQNWLKKSFL